MPQCLINPSYIPSILHGQFSATGKLGAAGFAQLSARPLNPLAVAVGGIKKRRRDHVWPIAVKSRNHTCITYFTVRYRRNLVMREVIGRRDLRWIRQFSIWKKSGGISTLLLPSLFSPFLLYVLCTFFFYPFIRDFSTARILFRWNLHWSALWSLKWHSKSRSGQASWRRENSSRK